MFGRNPNAFEDSRNSEPLDIEATEEQVNELQDRATQMRMSLFPTIAQHLEGGQLDRHYITAQLIPLTDTPDFDEIHQEVISILKHRKTKQGMRYQVLWKDRDKTYISAKDFDSMDMIQSYWAK
ncbi:hypothetical protein IWW50_003535, partial [Coemansia erecta]